MHEINKLLCFLIILLFFIVLLGTIYQYQYADLFLEYRTNNNNGRKYGIQEKLQNSDNAVQILGQLHDDMEKFIKYLEKKHHNDSRVKRLVKGFKDVKIEETTEEPGDDNTSFTINKGELMSLCLRNDSPGRPFHDYNTLLFVVIHELAHIASLTEGHNIEFIINFKFLLKEAVELGFYNPIDYSKEPFLYCGKIKVTNNPFY